MCVSVLVIVPLNPYALFFPLQFLSLSLVIQIVI